MRIEWSEIAYEDLAAIRAYIERDAPYYADQFILRLMTATDNLAVFPEMSRKVPEAGESNQFIRELFYRRYRLIYQYLPSENRVIVLTVVHGNRDLSDEDVKPWEIA